MASNTHLPCQAGTYDPTKGATLEDGNTAVADRQKLSPDSSCDALERWYGMGHKLLVYHWPCRTGGRDSRGIAETRAYHRLAVQSRTEIELSLAERYSCTGRVAPRAGDYASDSTREPCLVFEAEDSCDKHISER